MRGRIIKGIAGFYYVHAEGFGTYECKAKGAFRNQKLKPLVGDMVEIEILNEEEKTGNLVEILPRASELIRPAVANVDQALVIFAAAKPKPNLSLLDRFLIMMDRQGIETIICFNKTDEASEKEKERIQNVYVGCGCKVLFTCAKQGQGVDELRRLLLGHTTTVAGPSGVGKSTLINLLVPDADMETGRISEKIDRGKHTTRHSELFRMDTDSYIFDTPGFSSLELTDMKKEELRYSFPEFREYEGGCRFQGCLHQKEPGCGVKEAVEAGTVNKERYESYTILFQELQEREKRRYS
ncbi:MAG: ribosome small subunit-dependent GTPase A [Lachnospiraceae bacterium]|nr:ribosome small subunit-dependent GTPase A [Lachnospiraceae bacterium]